MNRYLMQEADQINQAISEMPTAELWDIRAYPKDLLPEDVPRFAEPVKNFKAVRVTEKTGKVSYVSIPTKRYHLVQHEQAFRPIIEGLTVAGITDFKFIAVSDNRKASLQVFVDNFDVGDSVMLGIKATNSFDSSRAIKFGFDYSKRKGYIELVGYRQVCSNGMMVRVPLDQADIVTPEFKGKIQSVFAKDLKLKHTEKVEEKLEIVQYVTEALSLMRVPVRNLISRAQRFTFQDEEHLINLIEAHVGKRYKNKVRGLMEGNSLWDLYNAVTFLASHDDRLRPSTVDNLQQKAAKILVEVHQ